MRVRSWRTANFVGVVLSVVLWVVATVVGWIDSVAFVSHVSMLALVVGFVAAWRSDVPTEDPPGD